MERNLRLLTILLLLLAMLSVNAQDGAYLTEREANYLLERSELSFDDKNYLDALDGFTQLHEYDSTDIYYHLMVGICYSYDPDLKPKSIGIMEQIKNRNPDYNLIDFYLGRSYAVNYKFDKAIDILSKFIASPPKESEEEVKLANQIILNCRNAKEILQDTISKNKVENMGLPINSQYSEYVPVISADESIMIFTYRGIRTKGAENIERSSGSEAYKEDIFVSYKENGEWTEPQGIEGDINTNDHDAAIALSVDGQTLFIYKAGKNDGGDIYQSKLIGRSWSKPQKLKGDVNDRDSWEGSCSLSANGKTLYFASDRTGGLGGRDLYKADLQSDGSWGNVQNLGPGVNTPYNDDAPFIHSDSRTLYFSSEGRSSIGGYDIFSASLNDEGGFDEPKNLGYPINTIDDNRYFVLAADGNTGYYSGGGEPSIGEQDIFKITTNEIQKPVLALLLGNVYFNDVPVGSTINLYKNDNDKLEGIFKSNFKTGKYVMALVPGTYRIEIALSTGEIIKDSIDLSEIKEYTELLKDYRIYSNSNQIVENEPTVQKMLESKLREEGRQVDTLFTSTIESYEKKEIKEGAVFTFKNILYDFDKSDLRPEAKEELDKLVALLNKRENMKIEINSYTDAKRDYEKAKEIFRRKGYTYSAEEYERVIKIYNQELSQRRAQSVIDYLTKKGISKKRLVAKGYGEELPIASNDTEEGRQLNRRTEFKVIKK